MAKFGLDNIRNVALLSHSGCGKTSVAEAVLFNNKDINRLGKVDEGNTASDFDPDETKRKISINLTVLSTKAGENRVNLIDTPGYPDFVGEVIASISVCEGAILPICAASGVEVGTEQVWKSLEEAELPRIVFINKMDRENADFAKVVGQIREMFGTKCAPIQVPIGSQSDFKGYVDILTGKAYTGTEMAESATPADLADSVASYLEQLTESVAESDDALLEKYLDGQPLTTEEIAGALKTAVGEGKLIPITCGSALQNVGIQALVAAAISYLPSPHTAKPVTADGKELEVSDDGPLAAIVFKTAADPYVGKLTYFRVYRGTFTSNSHIWNQNRSAEERVGQLFVIKGKTQEAVDALGAGDIGAVAKLSVTTTGDTLCAKETPVTLKAAVFPSPIFSQAVYPKGKADVDKMGSSLTRLTEEDPTLRVTRDLATAETVLSGMGDTQLMVAAERMQRKFSVGVDLATPKVPYRETVTMTGKGEHKHKKQSGGHGQYGHVLLEIEPLERGAGAQFGERIVGGSIPKNYIPAVEKGVNEALAEGVIAGFPVVDVKAVCYDGSFHPVDSSEICFKIAGNQAFKRGMENGKPILLEPIMTLEVTVPEDFTGDIISDLNTKRARVAGMNPGGGKNIIEATVPQAEVLNYAIDLKSITQGRGTFTLEFDHFEEAPQMVTQKIVAERQAAKEN
jgi:elongation factor G